MSKPGSPSPNRPRRLAAFGGVLAAAALVAAFFLPLFRVDVASAGRLTRAVRESSSTRSLDPDIAEDFLSAFEAVEASGQVRPADLVHYARTAARQRDNIIYGGTHSGSAGDPAAPAFARMLLLLLLLAAVPPMGGLVLFCYFVVHGFRRVRSPMLILALIVGVLGMALPLGHQYARYRLEPFLLPALGYWLTLAGAGGLILVALFGVTVRNWWRVYVGGSVTLGCLAVIGWAYLQGALSL